jgi:hypothetical protein
MGGMVLTDRQFSKNSSNKANNISSKTKAAARLYVKNFIKGNGDGGNKTKSFYGLYSRVKGDNLVYAGENGGLIDLMALELLVVRVPGDASQKRLLMSAKMQILLGAVIRKEGGTVMQATEWQAKYTPTKYAGVPIIATGEDEGGDEIMQFNEKCGTNTDTGSIVCFRPGENDKEYVVGLGKHAAEGIFEVEEQGVIGTNDNTLVEGRCGMAVHHPKAAVRYAGIANQVSA